MEFKKANVYKAAILFFFARKKYIDLAVSHNMAINLLAPDINKRYQEGRFPSEGWKSESITHATESAAHVSKVLLKCFFLILMASVTALAIGFSMGSLNINLKINVSLLLVFIGTYFVSWATLTELGGGFETYSGEALHELVHLAIFKIIFIPGVFLLLLGVLI